MSTHLPLRLSCGFAALGLLASLAACNNDPGSGTLRIQYSFDPVTSCTEHEENITEIRVELRDGDMVEATETVPCDNAGGELTISADARTYDLVVQGIDADGDAALDNLGGAITDDRVEVIGGDDKDVPVTLGLAPARLEVFLSVLNGGFPAQCTAGSDIISVHGLRAEAWGTAGQLHSADFDYCDFVDFLPVPDETRLINGRLFQTVVLQPLDESGAPVGPTLQEDFAAPIGAGKSVRVAVECEASDCTVTVLAGDPGGPTTGDPTTGDPTTGDPTTGDPTTGGSTDGTGDSGADDTTGG